MSAPLEPQSLAEFLGVADPTVPPSEPRLVDFIDATNPQAFGLAVLNSREFKQYIVNGLLLGNLPGFSGVLRFFLEHALGKPVERVEVKDVTVPVENLTAEHLEERAARLAEMARFMRRAEQFDEPIASDSVH